MLFILAIAILFLAVLIFGALGFDVIKDYISKHKGGTIGYYLAMVFYFFGFVFHKSIAIFLSLCWKILNIKIGPEKKK